MARWLIALVLIVTAAAAGPFERIPAGDPLLDDLAVIRGSRLLDRTFGSGPGDELSRLQAALLWKAAYDELERRVAGSVRVVAAPAPAVQRLTAALQRSLGLLEPELSRLEVDRVIAQSLFDRAVLRLSSLDGARASSPESSALAAPSGPALPLPTVSTPLSLLGLTGTDGGSRRPLTGQAGRTASDAGGRLSAFRIGPAEAGVSLNQIRLFDRDDAGDRLFLQGHVLAADLRLALGDNRVLVEYARSVEEQLGQLTPEPLGAAFRASFYRQLGDSLALDLGFRRLTGSYLPFALPFGSAGTQSLAGVEGGMALSSSLWHLNARASVLWPQGERRGYANSLDALVNYRLADTWSVSLGYQTASRRRLTDVEDLWLNTVSAGLRFQASDRLSAEINYRFDITDRPDRGDRDGHTVGASLGLGF
ncbi:MAG: hypothetical protein IT204_07170 [Fimbriimonadaceae bacterium]|nr:hypothetical protein [Fimbriimonadaceae bacterium]